MGKIGHESTLIFFGRNTQANISFLSYLEQAGYNHGNRAMLNAEGLGERFVPEALIIDSGLASMEKVISFVETLRAKEGLKEAAILVLVSQRELAEDALDPSVALFQAGASDVLSEESAPEVLVARLNTALRLLEKERPIPLTRSSHYPIFTAGIGDVLGHYRLDSIRGIGGMGMVYKGFDLRLERPVAVKVLPDDINLKKAHVERFLREAEIMARLNLPEVVRILDLGQEPVNYIVMEYIQGSDFEQILGDGTLPPQEVMAMARQVARILHRIHEASIIHRDLKPSNIFRDLQGRIRLLDFGISKLLDAVVPLTRPGATMGTPVYMAPEQFEHKLGEIGRWTDIYALGVIIYELIVGDVPFRQLGIVNTIKEIVMGSPMALRKVRPDIDPRLEKVVLKATARQPHKRYATALEMAEALEF